MKYTKINTAGQITAIIDEKYTESDQPSISVDIMKKNEDIEQVLFITNLYSSMPKLKMMGGELSLNGILAGAIYILNYKQKNKGKINFYGIKTPIQIKKQKNIISAIIPKEIIGEISSNIVNLRGITYKIVPNFPKTEIISSQQKYDLKMLTNTTPAAGIIYYEDNEIKPLVYVKATNTYVWESACGSGSLAFFLISKIETISQPSGQEISFKNKNGKLLISSKTQNLGKTNMKKQIQTLKGFRDFLPEEKRNRDFVQQKIIKTFQRFGFEPLETPTLEYASLLLDKYGDEANKLVYSFEDRGGRKVALRYDQTVPTARVTTQYQNELPPLFRRYQIQNVFRADKPQKGRYREFTQCDIDIFGNTTSLADAEIIACTYSSFKNIGFDKIEIRLNDRQVLFDVLSPFVTDNVDLFSIIQSIDKLDKMSEDKVAIELVNKGLNETNAKEALEKINQAKPSENLSEIMNACINLGVPKNNLVFTPTLARGLDYYTGMIFEVIIPDYPVGSCGGGGRYDKLIGNLGGIDTPAVGVGLGFDRIVEAAKDLNLIPSNSSGTKILVTFFDEKSLQTTLQVATKLRSAGINTELYPKQDKLGKQFKLANKKKIPFVVVIGEEEIANNVITLKNMESGEQKQLSITDTVSYVKKNT